MPEFLYDLNMFSGSSVLMHFAMSLPAGLQRSQEKSSICPSLEDFSFTSWNPEQVSETTQPDIISILWSTALVPGNEMSYWVCWAPDMPGWPLKPLPTHFNICSFKSWFGI